MIDTLYVIVTLVGLVVLSKFLNYVHLAMKRSILIYLIITWGWGWILGQIIINLGLKGLLQ